MLLLEEEESFDPSLDVTRTTPFFLDRLDPESVLAHSEFVDLAVVRTGWPVAASRASARSRGLSRRFFTPRPLQTAFSDFGRSNNIANVARASPSSDDGQRRRYLTT